MNDPEQLQRLLESMPEAPVPDSLWPRVREQRRRQLRRRRIGTGLASTALAALLLVSAWPDRPTRSPGPAAQPPVLAGHGTDERVRALDQALQTAYERGASDDEVAPLWEARRALLVQHHAPRDGASNVNDI